LPAGKNKHRICWQRKIKAEFAGKKNKSKVPLRENKIGRWKNRKSKRRPEKNHAPG
jgi:hypothetical protein